MTLLPAKKATSIPLRSAAGLKPVLLAAALCLLACGCRTNPVTGQKELVIVSAAQELALGDNYHPNLIFMYESEYQDTELKRYLGTIVRRLHECSHRREMPTDFTLLNSSIYNAFATPGHVYATRGLLAKLANEAQFSAVMGHELAHVAAGHTAKKLSDQALAAAGLGLVGAALGDSTAAKGITAAGQASVAVLGLSYSREQERQADRVGTYYMALAGWDPRETISMQRLIASLTKREPTFLDRYLSSHPPANERTADIEALIQEKYLLTRGYVQGDGVYAERWNRRLADLRQVNQAYQPYDRGSEHLQKGEFQEALQAAEEAIRMRPDQAPFHRLKGDALLALERPRETREAYNESLRHDPRYVYANIGLGRVALRQKDFAEAERQFAIAARGFPASAQAHYGLGVSRVHLEKYAEAIPPLEIVVNAAPREPMVHYLLGVCYEETGQFLEALNAYSNALAAGLSSPQRERARTRVMALELQLTP